MPYIETTATLPKDTFNDDGTVTLPFLYFHIKDDVYFVEDDADLSGIKYKDHDIPHTAILNQRCLNVLKATDWYSIRKADVGTEVPENITALRNKMRALINSEE
tara:strand:- start:231 stop:542 length:312 start_codon:yes stop_codon:yes gene_type:complete